MHPDRPVTAEAVRQANCRAVYEILVGEAVYTRSDLAGESGLSVTTVNSILGEFMAVGLVVEAGPARRTGGRPAQLVQIDGNARFVLCADLSRARAKAVQFNLVGDRVRCVEGPLLSSECTEELLAWHKRLVAADPRIAVVSVAIPGVVDGASGHVHLAPRLGWDNYPFGEALHEATGLDVVLENDVNAMAVAELRACGAGVRQDTICVSIQSGIGAGLLLGGQLHRGASWAAGEIGYSRFPGMVESEATDMRHPGPLVGRLLQYSRSLTASESGPGDVPDVALRRVARDLGWLMHNAACLLNPDAVVIAWPDGPVDELVELMRADWVVPGHTDLRSSAVGEDGVLEGMSHLALEYLKTKLCASRHMERVPDRRSRNMA